MLDPLEAKKMFAIIGGNGYIGTAFQRHLMLSQRDFHVLSRSRVNYYDPDTLIHELRSCGATFVINAAGFMGLPNVDTCELHKYECLNANTTLPGTIRDACEHLNLPWGHVSSGCVYSGNGLDGKGYTEEDTPNFDFRHNNCSFYSGCKAMAEEVLEQAEQCYVWRIRVPFTSVDSPRNYISKLLQYDQLLNVRNSLSQVDQFVDCCIQSWDTRIDFGKYNLTNPGSVTTRDVVKLLQRNGLTDKTFSFFDNESEFMANAASAPRSHCVLNSTKALDAGLRLSPVEEALDHAMKNWNVSYQTSMC